MASVVVRRARVMTCDPTRPGLGILESAALAAANGVIEWIGTDSELPASLAGGANEIDAGGRLVTPGLVDCHTHAIFAGDRANEFAMRAAGATYLEIAAAGGGIRASTGPTRAASEEELIALLHERLDAARAAGTTAIEVKSGYDLTVAGELRLLRCIAAAAAGSRSRVVPTLLVHLVPAERAADREAYVASVCTELIPEAGRAALATSVDVYCDDGAYTLAETRAILTAARTAGLAVRAHVGQFADLGGAELLAELGGLSADHLEQVAPAGIAALARAGVVAVMLPGACVQLRLPVPPIAALRTAGVRMAIGSDLNPGSSYCESLAVPMWLATTHYNMTVEETWLGVTRHAAAALALDAGSLVRGGRADFVLWRAAQPADIPYRYGRSLVDRVFTSR
jgi:imidazolonepropionase